MTPYTNRESFVWTCTVHTISALFCTVSFVLFRYFDLFFLSSSSSFYSCHLLAVAFRFSWTIFIFIENHVFSTLQRHRIKHFTQWIDHVWSNANTCMSARVCAHARSTNIIRQNNGVFFSTTHWYHSTHLMTDHSSEKSLFVSSVCWKNKIMNKKKSVANKFWSKKY